MYNVKRALVPGDMVHSAYKSGTGVYASLGVTHGHRMLCIMKSLTLVLTAPIPCADNNDMVLVISNGIVGYSFCRNLKQI